MSTLITELRERLLTSTGRPAAEVAVELAQLASLSGLGVLAALSIDRRLLPHQRVVALLAIAASLASEPGTPPPPDALDAVEDEETATVAIRSGCGAALTGVLAAAPRGVSLDVTRKLIGRRLVAAGERGPHVTRLLLDAGDRERAAQLAADDLARVFAERADATVEIWARLWLLLEWSTDEALLESIARALAAQQPAALDALAAALVELPGADPAAVRRVRSLLVWIDRG